MKTLMMTLLFVAATLTAQAGQVIQLGSGQTYPLSNGDVVACMGMVAPSPAVQPAPPKQITCRLFINGLPVFYGDAWTEDDAKRMATIECEKHAMTLNFSDKSLANGKVCQRGSPFHSGFSCK